MPDFMDATRVEFLISKIEMLKVENMKLKDALRFYAEPDNFCLLEDLSTEDWKDNWIGERLPGTLHKIGSTARKVLALEREVKGDD